MVSNSPYYNKTHDADGNKIAPACDATCQGAQQQQEAAYAQLAQQREAAHHQELKTKAEDIVHRNVARAQFAFDLLKMVGDLGLLFVDGISENWYGLGMDGISTASDLLATIKDFSKGWGAGPPTWLSSVKEIVDIFSGFAKVGRLVLGGLQFFNPAAYLRNGVKTLMNAFQNMATYSGPQSQDTERRLKKEDSPLS